MLNSINCNISYKPLFKGGIKEVKDKLGNVIIKEKISDYSSVDKLNEITQTINENEPDSIKKSKDGDCTTSSLIYVWNNKSTTKINIIECPSSSVPIMVEKVIQQRRGRTYTENLYTDTVKEKEAFKTLKASITQYIR